MVSSLNRTIAERILNELRIHNVEAGGTVLGVIAEKGSGKTQFLYHLAPQILYIDPERGIPRRETIIYRGRKDDYWSWMYEPDFEWEGPAFRRKVYIHYHADDSPYFSHKTTHGQLGAPIRFPPDALKPYRLPIDLYHNLVPGEFNVIYEPTKYTLSQAMGDHITARSCTAAKQLKNLRLDPPLWWVEFVSFLLRYKGKEFISIFIDEIADILMDASRVSGVHWHMQGTFCDEMRDFRRNNLSLYYSIHKTSDVDYRIFPKTQYFGYMFEGNLRPGSKIPRGTTSNLPIGEVVLERGGYGSVNLGKLKHRDLVTVSFGKNKRDFSAWGIPWQDPAEEEKEEKVRFDPITCPLCGYTWNPKTATPKRCPNCNAILTLEEVLRKHSEVLQEDPERLSTDFLKKLIGSTAQDCP